jgi:hypothetical protein
LKIQLLWFFFCKSTLTTFPATLYGFDSDTKKIVFYITYFCISLTWAELSQVKMHIKSLQKDTYIIRFHWILKPSSTYIFLKLLLANTYVIKINPIIAFRKILIFEKIS